MANDARGNAISYGGTYAIAGTARALEGTTKVGLVLPDGAVIRATSTDLLKVSDLVDGVPSTWEEEATRVDLAATNLNRILLFRDDAGATWDSTGVESVCRWPFKIEKVWALTRFFNPVGAQNWYARILKAGVVQGTALLSAVSAGAWAIAVGSATFSPAISLAEGDRWSADLKEGTTGTIDAPLMRLIIGMRRTS